jgi:hypothetical protein
VKSLIGAILFFLLFCAIWVFALYGVKCAFFKERITLSGAGCDGVVQVWEGK